MQVPKEIQQVLIKELPNVVEQIDEAAKQIYDPNTIWLEAMQYADYVSQFGKHLQENHGEDCVADIANGLIQISESFKSMGESALQVIDESEKRKNGTQQ